VKIDSESFRSERAPARPPWLLSCLLIACAVCFPLSGYGQQELPDPLSKPAQSDQLLTSTIPPGTVFLFGLERKFAAAVAKGGGPAFASFFDKNGMTLANRKPPLVGQQSIAAHATWSPDAYQLTWTPEGGELSPDGTMGYTWGHYEGWSLKGAGIERGRYVTVWKKEPDGSWKVVLDSSNEDPPQAECKCTVGAKH